MPSDAYFQIMAERASREQFDESQPFEEASIEYGGSSSESIFTYAENNRDSFLRLLAILSPQNQDIAIEYILLRKTEKQIAVLHGYSSQGSMAHRIALIVRSLGAVLAIGLNPAPAILQAICAREGLGPEVAREITGSRDAKTLRMARERLEKSSSLRARALAEYIRNLSPKKSPQKSVMTLADPDILGSVKCTMNNPALGTLFSARACQSCNASHL